MVAFCLQIIDKILSELEPVCLSEQDFCVRFFHLAGETSVGKEIRQVKKLELYVHFGLFLGLKP